MFVLPKTVASCRYLTEEQKTIVYRALENEGQRQEVNVRAVLDSWARIPADVPWDKQEKFSYKAAAEALKSPQAWFMTAIFFPAGATLFAIAYFAPSKSSFFHCPTRQAEELSSRRWSTRLHRC